MSLARRIVARFVEADAHLSRRRFYHGTSYEFTAFDLSKAGARDFGDYGYGVYLTPSARMAANYAWASAKKTKQPAKVIAVTVHLQKTADFDDPAFRTQVFESLGLPVDKALSGSGPQTRPRADSVAITKYMQGQGYDSGLARGGKELVVYDARLLTIDEVYPAEDAGGLL